MCIIQTDGGGNNQYEFPPRPIEFLGNNSKYSQIMNLFELIVQK